MANEPLAWLLTYAIHSTLLLGGAWLLSLLLPDRARVVRETAWKVALVGAFVTASFQVVHSTAAEEAQQGAQPTATTGSSGGLTIRLGPPANASASTDRSVDAVVSSRSMSDWGDHFEPVPRAEAGDQGTYSSRLDRFFAGGGALHQLAELGKSSIRSQSIAMERSLMLGFGALWLLVALFGTFRILRAHFALRRRIRGRRELQEGAVHRSLARLCRRAGVRQHVRLTQSDAIEGPMAIGLSEICVPTRALTDLSEEELEALLAHELGHLVRRDPLWATISFAVENVFLFQPLNRLAGRRIQHEAEFLADDWAIEQTGSGFSLARCLATVAGWVAGTAELRTASAMAGSSSPLASRVERLLDGDSGKPGRFVRWVRVPVTVSLLLAIVLLAPEVTARVARPHQHGRTVAIAPHPPLPGLAHLESLAHLDQFDEFDRYTMRVENDEHGVVEVRVEDGEVLGVRLDGETLPEDRYSIEDDLLIVEDEEGHEIAAVDLDIQARLERHRDGLAGRLTRLQYLDSEALAELRDRVQTLHLDADVLRRKLQTDADVLRRKLQIDADSLRSSADRTRSDADELHRRIEIEIDADAIHREAVQIDAEELRRLIEVEIDEAEIRRALRDAGIGGGPIRHRIRIEAHDDEDWDSEDEDMDPNELRRELDESFDAEREAIDAYLDALHEELDGLDEDDRREALQEIEEEREELLEELAQDKERAVKRLERDLELHRERSRVREGSDRWHEESASDIPMFAFAAVPPVPPIGTLAPDDIWVVTQDDLSGRRLPPFDATLPSTVWVPAPVVPAPPRAEAPPVPRVDAPSPPSVVSDPPAPAVAPTPPPAQDTTAPRAAPVPR